MIREIKKEEKEDCSEYYSEEDSKKKASDPEEEYGEEEDDENFLPPERQKPKAGNGDPKKGKPGEEQKMTEQEARGSLEGLKNEFGRKMPAGGQDNKGGKGGKPGDKKGKDY